MPAIFTVEIAIKRKNKTAAMVRLGGCSYHILQITNKKHVQNKTNYMKCRDSNQRCWYKTSGIPVFGR